VGEDGVDAGSTDPDQGDQVSPDGRIDVAHVDEGGRDRGPGAAVRACVDLVEDEQPGEVRGSQPLERDGPIRGGIGHGGQQALEVAGLARPDPGTDREGHLVRHGPTPEVGR
jgi:hypothetical protein